MLNMKVRLFREWIFSFTYAGFWDFPILCQNRKNRTNKQKNPKQKTLEVFWSKSELKLDREETG